MAEERLVAKDPAKLSRADLVEIVRQLQYTLFLDVDKDDNEFWNLQKEIGGSEFIDTVVNTFEHFGILPVEGPKEWRPKRGRS